jgi:transposase-like protein
MKIKYCPKCGSKLELKESGTLLEKFQVWSCEKCHYCKEYVEEKEIKFWWNIWNVDE